MVWLASPWLDLPRKGAANEFRAPGSSTEDFFARMRLHRKRSWHMTEDEKEFLESENQLARFTYSCGVPVVLQEWHRVFSFAAGQAQCLGVCIETRTELLEPGCPSKTDCPSRI